MRPLSGDVHPASIPTRPVHRAESPLRTSVPSVRRTSALATPSKSPRPSATGPQVLLSGRDVCDESARPFAPETSVRRPVDVAPPAVCHALPNLPARPVLAGRPSSLHLHTRVVQTLDLEDEVRESGIDRIRRRAADATTGERDVARPSRGTAEPPESASPARGEWSVAACDATNLPKPARPGGRGARRFLTGAVCVSRGPRRASRRRRG